MNNLSSDPSFAYAIAVAGSDIYTSGIFDLGNGTEPVYWKNAVSNPLPNDKGVFIPNSICLSPK